MNWLKRLWHPRTPGGSSPAGASRGPAAPPTDAEGHPLPLRIRVGAVTTVGNYREHNEDNYFVPGGVTVDSKPEGLDGPLDFFLSPPSPSASPASASNGAARPGTSSGVGPADVAGPFIVADGMGGQLAGEQASRLAVEVIPKDLAWRIDKEPEAEAIRHAIAKANQEIIAQAHVVPECAYMGTTVVMALFRYGRMLVAGVGDSRAYRLRAGTLERLTRDHDLASALTDAGTIRPEEAKNHQFRNVLYLFLGSPDARNGPEDVRDDPLMPGDRFLLASDGLTGVVSDEEIAQRLATGDDPQAIARDLVDLALKNDSRDNVTCMVIAVEGQGALHPNGAAEAKAEPSP